ncbi:PAS domain-containing protein [Desulfohalobium retbaense]|uniref:PAS/PAC sensor protein n=1 Tax=Desulfohalobium retbaense (strain ATCC 49708 / DSM 5692 / JCM 16813 / HR100) TaxID=485915 RepID=C8WZ80_DESRD|nr:PAS domain S-box protein [Desulfohalobium retbaense]ACV67355.1 putative PAS/PAC sensor protein [Desulfohalobium retbaense DSM 5692]
MSEEYATDDRIRELEAELAAAKKRLAALEKRQESDAPPAMLQDVLDGIDMDIHITDSHEGTILMANARMYTTYSGTIVGRHCWDVIRNANSPCPGCMVEQLDDPKVPSVRWEDYNLAAGGWFEHIARRITWQDGRPAVLHISRNTTEAHETARAYRRSERKYRRMNRLLRLMADNVPDLIWAKDLDDQYLFANKAICKQLLRCSDPELPLGKTDLYFAERERRWGHDHTFGEICIDSDQVVKANRKSGRFLEDGKVRGRYLVLDVHKAPFFDEDGAMIGTVGAAREVTEEIQRQQELDDIQSKYRLILENCNDGIGVNGPDGFFRWVNPSLCRICGFSEQELLKHRTTTFVDPRDQNWVWDYFRQRLDPEQPDPEQVYPFRIVRKDGVVRWLQASVVKIEWNDRPAALVFYTDITGRYPHLD